MHTTSLLTGYRKLEMLTHGFNVKHVVRVFHSLVIQAYEKQAETKEHPIEHCHS